MLSRNARRPLDASNPGEIILPAETVECSRCGSYFRKEDAPISNQNASSMVIVVVLGVYYLCIRLYTTSKMVNEGYNQNVFQIDSS